MIFLFLLLSFLLQQILSEFYCLTVGAACAFKIIMLCVVDTKTELSSWSETLSPDRQVLLTSFMLWKITLWSSPLQFIVICLCRNVPQFCDSTSKLSIKFVKILMTNLIVYRLEEKGAASAVNLPHLRDFLYVVKVLTYQFLERFDRVEIDKLLIEDLASYSPYIYSVWPSQFHRKCKYTILSEMHK